MPSNKLAELSANLERPLIFPQTRRSSIIIQYIFENLYAVLAFDQ